MQFSCWRDPSFDVEGILQRLVARSKESLVVVVVAVIALAALNDAPVLAVLLRDKRNNWRGCFALVRGSRLLCRNGAAANRLHLLRRWHHCHSKIIVDVAASRQP